VRRYLHELSLIVDIESLETTPGGPHLWRIKPSERGRSVALRRTQAYGVLGARRVFDVLKGSALYDELDVAMREVMQIAHRPTRGAVKGEVPSDQRLEDRFLYVPAGPVRSYAHKIEVLDDVFHAVADLRALRLRYRAPGEKARLLVLHPYAMLIHKGAVLVLGRDVERQEVAVMSLDRIDDTQPSDGEHFRLPRDFDLSEYLHGEFGVRAPPTGTKPTRVLVEFEPSVGEEIRAQRFHPTQRIATAPDGRVRVSMNVVGMEGVRGWVLSYGAAARVIEPAELAAEMAGELRRALARY
jgi:predicted DNA-binding transcriptional regulator YafY